MQPKHPDLLYSVLRSFCSKSTPFTISHIRINEPLQHCSVYTSIHLHTFPLPCSLLLPCDHQPLACNCDPNGANGSICEPLGGQCPCYSPASFEDVTSTDRECSLCPLYYYGPTSSGCMRECHI